MSSNTNLNISVKIIVPVPVHVHVTFWHHIPVLSFLYSLPCCVPIPHFQCSCPNGYAHWLIYKTPNFVCYSICLNINFDHCFHCLLNLWSLPTSLWTSKLWFLNYWKYSSFIIKSMLISIKATLSLELSSKLWTLIIEILGCAIVGWHSAWAEATVWTPSEFRLPVE